MDHRDQHRHPPHKLGRALESVRLPKRLALPPAEGLAAVAGVAACFGSPRRERSEGLKGDYFACVVEMSAPIRARFGLRVSVT